MGRDEIVKTLVIKYGAIAVSRKFIREMRGALANIRNGIETENFALAAKDVGLLADNLANLETLFHEEKHLEQLQLLEKDIK